ncbi:pentapeptide repeat-containing protein [Maricaulis sp.]|uniref:pentapeptide repeat-containing protein n=1 Tax=Maricaulis sp. TaxID=1486257 RepID=UPI001B02B4C6|nr:pentapeptide repeat-containing protein [Maricaulis sp.]MBO6764141.1 pentapeptide repeat-containing protein [Maricaulis sp.]
MQGRKIEFKMLNQAQVDMICERHERLWSGKAGGARASFAYSIVENLDLSNRDLSDADFSGAVLRGANLSGATLNSAIFFAADLRRASLEGACLRRADLRGAIMRGANLTGADLTEADLREGAIAQIDKEKGLAVLTHKTQGNDSDKANFTGANLSRSKMAGITAQKFDFTDAMLLGTRMIRANLRGSSFQGANLEGADLSGADLTDTDFTNAVLIGTKTVMAKKDRMRTDGALTEAPVGIDANTLDNPVANQIAEHMKWCETNGREGKPSLFDGTDLRGLTSLAGKTLTAFHARGATLYGLDLEGAQLQGARLEKADLRMVSLRGADLRGADLTGANLSNADLRDCQLGPLLLEGNRILPASLAGTRARYTDFRGADLRQVKATGADFSYAHLDGSDARRALFGGSCFTGTSFDERFLEQVASIEGAVDLNAA